ncbi:unnamed protein product [Diamesa hyperborea]
MKWNILVLLVVINAVKDSSCASQNDEYCYSNDPDKKQARYYSTKTAYEVARGSEKKYFTVPRCEPAKFWLLSRHGTRLPSANGMKNLQNLVDVRDQIIESFQRRDRDRHLSQLCGEDLELLKKWNWDRNITESFSNFLTVQGWNDMKYMALDYQRTFQRVMETTYTKRNYHFSYTDTQRTEASYKAFTEGLFGPGADGFINISPESNDSLLLRPYDKCSEWNTQQDMYKGNDSEYFKFQNTDLFKKTLGDISIRLGFKYTLHANQVEDIWDMCRYDQSWFLQEDSPWCVAFTPEHVKVLEYLEDLKYYYKSGYGSALNNNIMCGAVQDLMSNLKNEGTPNVVAYFSHASAIQLMLVALGYAKDAESLRADNYDQMKNRKWRTSVISPFASNLAVVKYDCPNEPERFKVQFFLNEKPIDFPWCNIGLCDLSKVFETYQKFIDVDCSKIYCGTSTATSLKYSFAFILIAKIISYAF